MGAVTGIITDGIKQFGGEIIGGILFAVVLWMFPGLRKFFGRDKARNEDDTEAETRRQLEILQEEEQQLAYLKEALKRHDEALKLTETQTEEESRRKSEIHRQLEEQRREEERVKAEIQRKQEELRKAEEKRAEETRQKAELARQLEKKRREEERIRAEIQRKQEALRQAEARKAEEARQREEAQRQLEAMRENSESQNSDELGDKISKVIECAFAILLAIYAYILLPEICDFSKPTIAKVQHKSGNRSYKRAKNSEDVALHIRAAEEGYIWAAYYLGEIYEYGDGVSKDINEARKWYQKAADHGLQDAKEALKHLAAK